MIDNAKSIVLVILVIFSIALSRIIHTLKIRYDYFYATLVYIISALLFGLFLFLFCASGKSILFLTGYIIEYTLSIDNIFLFLVVQRSFDFNDDAMQRLLRYGILLTLILRYIFISIGLELITKFAFILPIFGIILIYSAIKLFQGCNINAVQCNGFMNTRFVSCIKKILPISHETVSTHFIIRQNNAIYLTPIFLALILVCIGDLVCAIDSVPAIFSITSDKFLIYSSNIFAILGLRSLYFVIKDIAEKLKYIEHAISIILFFIGLKLFLNYFAHNLINEIHTLLFILGTIFIATIKSARYKSSNGGSGWT